MSVALAPEAKLMVPSARKIPETAISALLESMQVEVLVELRSLGRGKFPRLGEIIILPETIKKSRALLGTMVLFCKFRLPSIKMTFFCPAERVRGVLRVKSAAPFKFIWQTQESP